MRCEIRKDGKRYRVIRHSQEEYKGGVHNVKLRNATYAECEAYVALCLPPSMGVRGV